MSKNKSTLVTNPKFWIAVAVIVVAIAAVLMATYFGQPEPQIMAPGPNYSSPTPVEIS